MMRYSLRIIDNRKDVVLSKHQLGELVEFVNKTRKLTRRVVLITGTSLLICSVIIWVVIKNK